LLFYNNFIVILYHLHKKTPIVAELLATISRCFQYLQSFCCYVVHLINFHHAQNARHMA